MVVRADVLPDRFWVVPFQHCGAELFRLRTSRLKPKPLGGFGVGVLMDVDPENQSVPPDPCDVEEVEKEPD